MSSVGAPRDRYQGEVWHWLKKAGILSGLNFGKAPKEDARYGRIIPGSVPDEQSPSKIPAGTDLPADGQHRPDRPALADQSCRRRQVCYPAHWAWETEHPFALAQVDVKDIHDEATLGPRLVHHLQQAKLPRYQWTFLEGSTRLRFLAFSHQLSRTNALCFAGLVLFWLRAHGITRNWAL